jgi:hypothetical protein
MSTWINIKKQEDVEYDNPPYSEESIDVFIGVDNFGSNYVSIPLRFIIEALQDNGYKIEK